MSVNLFEVASRESYRFPSSRGQLSTEQLWSLPLTAAKTGFSLNDVAKAVNAELKASGEESFVEAESNPERAKWAAKLEIVKHIIAYRQAENAEARNVATRKAEKEKLLALIADKQDAALGELTIEELTARVAAL